MKKKPVYVQDGWNFKKIYFFNVIESKNTETENGLRVHLDKRFLVQGASGKTW